MADQRLKLCKATWPDMIITDLDGYIGLGTWSIPVEPELSWPEWKKKTIRRISAVRGCAICMDDDDHKKHDLYCVICTGAVCMDCLVTMQSRRLAEASEYRRTLALSIMTERIRVYKLSQNHSHNDVYYVMSEVDEICGVDPIMPCPYCRQSMVCSN